MDSIHKQTALRYLCHLCLTVYSSADALEQHLAAQTAQLQRPAEMISCATCTGLATQDIFRHLYDCHLYIWQAHHLRVTAANGWADPANPVALYSRQNALGKPNDVIVQRWGSDAVDTIKTSLTPFYCACCNHVSLLLACFA
jgi:hypothetical protein